MADFIPPPPPASRHELSLATRALGLDRVARRASRPTALRAGLALALSLIASAAASPEPFAPSTSGPAGMQSLDFGGAEIDEVAQLRRNFGLDTDLVRSVRSGDLDGDGLLDLVVGKVGADAVYLNAGGGDFEPEAMVLAIEPAPGEDPDHFELGDLDLDGDLDAVGWPAGSGVDGARIYLNDGLGQLALPADSSETEPNVSDVAIAALDGDRSLDLVLARDLPTGGGDAQNSYMLYDENDPTTGTPTFFAETDLGAPDEATRALALGDLDEDGDVDIVVANGEEGYAQISAIYFNDGGSFASGANACSPQWEWGIPSSGPGSAYSGQRLWATVLDGTYDNDKDVWITSPTIDLSGAGGSQINLSFQAWIDAAARESIDELRVEVTKNGGASWQAVWSNQAGAPPQTWFAVSVDLDASHAVADFQLRLRMISDAADVADGFYVDDVTVSVGGSAAYSSDFEPDDGGFVSSETQNTTCLGRVGYDTRSVALGDMDADGHLDIVLGNAGILRRVPGGTDVVENGQERIYLGDGSGGFDSAAILVDGGKAGDDTTVAIDLGDVNGDGRLDLLIADATGQDQVCYHDGGATPSLDACDDLGTGSAPTRSAILADLDDDGALDAALGYDQQQSRAFLSPGALAFVDDSASTFGGRVDRATAIALGDLNRDGHLDAVVGNLPRGLGDNEGYSAYSQLFLNDGSGAFPGLDDATFAAAAPTGDTRAVAVADLYGDRVLSVLLGVEGGPNAILDFVWDPFTYEITSVERACPDPCFGSGDDDTFALATGDLDWDGTLDIVVGNDGTNSVHFNDGFANFSQPGASADFGAEDEWTVSVALGDLDGDGYLDVVAGNRDGQNVAYLNDGAGGIGSSAEAVLPFGIAQDTRSLALGDVDGDGKLDAVVGNHMQQNRIFLGDGNGGLGGTAGTIDFGNGADATTAVALGDLNGDGALDIVVANEDEDNTVYLNDRGSPPRFDRQRPFGATSGGYMARTTGLALGDLDGNGTLDIVTANQGILVDGGLVHGPRNEVFLNRYRDSERLPFEMPSMHVYTPDAPPEAPGFTLPQISTSRYEIPFQLELEHPEDVTIARLEGFYSVDGGVWRPAALQRDLGGELGLGPVTNLRTSDSPITLYWDSFASGFFGQSDAVRMRIRAHLQSTPVDAGSPNYTQDVAGPIQWPYVTATSDVFRVRGNQARVLRENVAGEPAPDALVYRLPAGQSEGAEPFSNAGGTPLRTDAEGYLRGSGSFDQGDTLFALAPITETEHYVVYHSSATVTEAGLDGTLVEEPGVTTLVVEERKPLMLFNLDLSLEWDARNDEGFMQQLRDDLVRSSEILFDVTNGQVALGPVRVFHAKQEWLAADVIVHAANNLRPAASLGGVVDDLVDDQLKDDRVIEDAYVPGQIQMGPGWGRFGDPGADLGDDWPRALAHELGHYLLFQFDNYLGVVDGRMVPNDCIGSYMTDAYIDEYSELLDEADWTGACLDTLAEYTTGRTDWETLLTFYPWLNKDNLPLAGPSSLPLAVTTVEEIDPGYESVALSSPFYSLREGTERLFVGAGSGQGYLFKNQGTSELTDDYVVPVGSPVGDQMNARGAEPGDRLCVIERQRDPVRIGCTTVGQFEGTLQMSPVPGWMPQIKVSPVATDTLAITVTQSASLGLFAQVLPPSGILSTFPITSTVAELQPVPGEPDTFATQVQLAYPTFEALVRIWEPGSSPAREAMTQFVLGEGWGPNRQSWGPNRRSFGPNRRSFGPNRRSFGAPVSSGDGQVTVYNLSDILGDTGTSALQSLSTLPSIPSWLRPIGNVQRFEAAEPLVRTLAFLYLQQDVPGGAVYEDGARIYYSPDDGATWQVLDTVLDTLDNLATTEMPFANGGDGLYMLAITIPMPGMSAGWNQLGYPVAGERPVEDALAAIEGDYRLVYDNGPTADGAWRLYDTEVLVERPELADLVNDLASLEFGGVYWIYALRDTEPFFGLPSLPGDGDAEIEPLQTSDEAEALPPATVYGWVTPSAGFNPSAGMEVLATTNGQVCGEAIVEDYDGQLAYRIQIEAERPGRPDCASDGDLVRFSIGGQTLFETVTWDNSQATYLPLGTLATGADLAVEQVVIPSAPQAGRPFTYLVTVRNLGPLSATDVELTSLGPQGSQLIVATTEQRYCQQVGLQSTCLLGTLPAGSSQVVLVTVELPSPGTVQHDVSVTAFEPDPNPDNNQIEEEHPVVPQGQDLPPTAVQMLDFEAYSEPGHRHEVNWSTASEVDVLGFIVYGAPSREGPYRRVLAEVVPARAAPSSGARYQIRLRSGGATFYRLETVTLSGLPEHFGPVAVQAREARSFIPMLLQR